MNLLKKYSLLTMVSLLCVTLMGMWYIGLAESSAEPPYAKWGSIAMQETKKRYPDAQIIDYLHIGRTTPAPSVSEENFKLWLKQNNREFGVYVTIRFKSDNEELISIDFEESSSNF